jgi:hypothetical protein
VIEATARPGKVLTGNAVTDAAHMDATAHMTATEPAHVAATEPAAHVAAAEPATHVAAAAAHVAATTAAHVAATTATTTACKRVSRQSSCESDSRRQNNHRLT